MAYKIVNRTVHRCFSICVLASLFSAAAHAQVSPAQIGKAPAMAQPQLDHWRLQAQDNSELYIPPAAERPLGEDDGPRIPVSSLDLDVDPSLASMLDAELNAAMALILSSRVSANSAQGFTIGRLENVAADITDKLRESGFILAYAYVPTQSVDGGSVTIAVLPGSLDTITVDGNRRYSEDRLTAPFSDLMGSPIRKTSIENSIMYLRDYPGLNTTAVFSPGRTTGTSELTLRVTEDPFDIGFVVDNHGTESTGENRIRSELSFHNVFGRADTLTGVILQTFDPAANLYGGVAYETPLFRHDWSAGLAFSVNSFDVKGSQLSGLEELGITGDTNIASAFVSKNLVRTRRAAADLAFSVSTKAAELKNTGTPTEDNLAVLALDFSAESVDSFGAGGINQLQLVYSQGLADFLGSMDEFGLSSNGAASTRPTAGGDFGKIALRYQRLQRISESLSVLLRLEGQESSDLLVSIEQFLMGGPNSVRAYPVAEFLMDKGAFGSLEFILDLDEVFGSGSSGANYALSAFGDYASGELNNPGIGQIPDADISGWGLGFTVAHTGNTGNLFSLRFDIAKPAGEEDASNGRNPQYFGTISYSFR